MTSIGTDLNEADKYPVLSVLNPVLTDITSTIDNHTQVLEFILKTLDQDTDVSIISSKTKKTLGAFKQHSEPVTDKSFVEFDAERTEFIDNKYNEIVSEKMQNEIENPDQ